MLNLRLIHTHVPSVEWFCSPPMLFKNTRLGKKIIMQDLKKWTIQCRVSAQVSLLRLQTGWIYLMMEKPNKVILNVQSAQSHWVNFITLEDSAAAVVGLHQLIKSTSQKSTKFRKSTLLIVLEVCDRQHFKEIEIVRLYWITKDRN